MAKRKCFLFLKANSSSLAAKLALRNNTNWKSLRRKKYQVLDAELEAKLIEEVFPMPKIKDDFEE